MWDDEDQQYYEVDADGHFYKVNSIAEYWTLITGIADKNQVAALKAKLFDPDQFWTDMPFSALAKNEADFTPAGYYWKGGVWAPAVYTVIKGLDAVGDTAAAQVAAMKYLNGISQVFDYTGTFWESYAPVAQTGKYLKASVTRVNTHEIVKNSDYLDDNLTYISPASGSNDENSATNLNEEGGKNNIVRPDFIGWTGLGPIALMIEDIIGINTDVNNRQIDWNLTRTDRNGVKQLSLGEYGTVSLVADARADINAGTKIHLSSNLQQAFSLMVRIGDHAYKIVIPAGEYEEIVAVNLPDEKTTKDNGGHQPTVDQLTHVRQKAHAISNHSVDREKREQTVVLKRKKVDHDVAAKQNTYPQTGDESATFVSLLGMLLMSSLAFLGFRRKY